MRLSIFRLPVIDVPFQRGRDLRHAGHLEKMQNGVTDHTSGDYVPGLKGRIPKNPSGGDGGEAVDIEKGN